MTLSVTSTDLDTFLDLDGDINAPRAELLLGLAQDLCSSIVSPVPDTAQGIVLGVAGRAYTNPDGVAAHTVGPESVTYGSALGGLFILPGEAKTLKRLAGRGGAFSIDTLPQGTSAVQLITITASAGTFLLNFIGQTAPIAWDPSATDVQNALEALGWIGAGNVSVTGTGPFTVSFINDLATTPIPTMTADTTELTGSVAVSVITAGVFAPGQRLPSWDRDYRNRGARVGGIV